jgi:hypothetical protein
MNFGLEQKRIRLPNAVDGLVPVELYLLSDRTVLFIPVIGFSPTYEDSLDGVSSFFDETGFKLWEPGSAVYSYDYHVAYPYNVMPLLRGWLIQQDLSKGQN